MFVRRSDGKDSESEQLHVPVSEYPNPKRSGLATRPVSASALTGERGESSLPSMLWESGYFSVQLKLSRDILAGIGMWLTAGGAYRWLAPF